MALYEKCVFLYSGLPFMPNYQLPPILAIKAPIIQLQREDGFVHPNKEAVLQKRINSLFEIYKIKNYTKLHLY